MQSIYEKMQDYKSFNLVAVGDALCHQPLYDYFKDGEKYDFTNLLSEYDLDKSNLNFYNQECVSSKLNNIRGGDKTRVKDAYLPHFNAPREFEYCLLDKGFNLVSLANNHALDMDIKGALEHIDFWNDQNVISAGMYKSKADRFAKKIYEKNGIKYAFFSYTSKYNSKENPKKYPYLRNDFDKELVRKDIESVKDEVDLIIVSIHWGKEYTFNINEDQKDIARFLSDLGVNIVIGNHPHCIQPVEMIGRTFVAYSLGNFIAKQTEEATYKRIGLELNIEIRKIKNKVKIIPKGKLNYIYHDEQNKNFKVIPFNKLTGEYLPGYQLIEKAYWDVVNKYNILQKL